MSVLAPAPSSRSEGRCREPLELFANQEPGVRVVDLRHGLVELQELELAATLHRRHEVDTERGPENCRSIREPVRAGRALADDVEDVLAVGGADLVGEPSSRETRSYGDVAVEHLPRSETTTVRTVFGPRDPQLREEPRSIRCSEVEAAIARPVQVHDFPDVRPWW